MFRSIASIAIAGLLFVGCGNGISRQAQEAVGMADAPSWAFEDNGIYTAVGFASIVDNNLNLAKTEARNHASRELAEEIQKEVSAAFSNETTRDKQTTMENVEDKIKTLTSLVLNGVHVEKFWFSEKKAAVLVRMQDGYVEKLRKDLQNMGVDYRAVEENMKNRGTKSNQ